MAPDPGCEVCPHPAAVAVPAPTNEELKAAGATFAVVATALDVSSNEISLARVPELYDPWLMIREIP